MQKNFSQFCKKNFSLYIHIPFCSRKCLFCSFVIAVGQNHRREEYVKALMNEMKNYAHQNITTIYFGGGTPSMMDEMHLEILMNALKENFLFQNGTELSIEVNPESIDRGKAKFLKFLGFNRISLGVQSMNEQYLKFLGRGHDAFQAREAYRILREAGLTNISLDLMYGFPGQTMEELEADVTAIGSMGSEHLSLYTLTIEPNSRFHAVQMKLDDPEKQAEQYLSIARILKQHGFRQYEVSNFAKPGFESKHNANYWKGGPYIGLGVGAHSFDSHKRYWNTSNFQDYMNKALQGHPTMEGFEDLTEDQLIMERVLFGLRMNEGIPCELLPKAKEPQVQTWIKDGFLLLEKGNLRTTDRGRLILDELCSRLI